MSVHRFYRHLEDGTRLLAVRRPEDGRWHAERIRADGTVVDWAYDRSLAAALRDLGIEPEPEETTA